MRVKFLATWGLLFSSAVGSPQPQPEPKPVPMPVPGNSVSQSSEDYLNPAHKIAIAGLVTGTFLTVATRLYDDYLSRYANRAATNEKGVQAQLIAFQNYIGELGKARDPRVDEMAKELNSRLWDIQNRYGYKLRNAGRTQVAGIYAEQGEDLHHLIQDLRHCLSEAQDWDNNHPHGTESSGQQTSYYGYSTRHQSFVKRAINDARQSGISSGSDYKKRDTGSKTGGILRLRNLAHRAQLLHIFDI
ncbi:uncharacterized protein PgNI_07792 [Pyricularia grisea]|uniref:Fungal N-terminal domain-containing protein n=1 Tax=Pyricularia grisea TaxID=148305 RepID=A0A6P8B2I5_PYRGI|nr:uncharacterized protein PgNI_07792 [Pyricularia grisea]TLD08928.1 hypothetical protein PgNI_07792 [Pyricularia grisea]